MYHNMHGAVLLRFCLTPFKKAHPAIMVVMWQVQLSK
jgi:hypothetical protein